MWLKKKNEVLVTKKISFTFFHPQIYLLSSQVLGFFLSLHHPSQYTHKTIHTQSLQIKLIHRSNRSEILLSWSTRLNKLGKIESYHDETAVYSADYNFTPSTMLEQEVTVKTVFLKLWLIPINALKISILGWSGLLKM